MFRGDPDRLIAFPSLRENILREAGKQILMGLREILDHRIQKMSERDAKGTSVPVD